MSPFKAGDRVVIPKGTPYLWATSPRMQDTPTHAKTTHTVKVNGVDPGYNGNPDRLRWAGSGGYWRVVAITQAIIDANTEATS